MAVQAGGGRRGGHSRRHVDSGRTGAARGAFGQAWPEARAAVEARAKLNAMRANRRSTRAKLRGAAGEG